MAKEKQAFDDRSGQQLCEQARLAATRLQKTLSELSSERVSSGKVSASVGVGLHFGDVSYGNIGAPERLDFTVLGPAVNLASRTEALTGALGCKVLCTKAFRKLDHRQTWKPRGAHLVKGVLEPVEVFELREISEADQ